MKVHDDLVCISCQSPASKIEEQAEARVTVTGHRPARVELAPDGSIVATGRGSFDLDDTRLWSGDLDDFDSSWFRCSECDAEANTVAELVERRVEYEHGDRFVLPDGRRVDVTGIRHDDVRESGLAPRCPVTEVLLDGEWWNVRDDRLEHWSPHPGQLDLLAVAA